MKKTIVNLYWNIAPALPFLFIALLVFSLGWKEIAPATYDGLAKWSLGVPAIIIFMLIPLQLIMPPDFSSWWYRRMVAKNQDLLAKSGMTPEQYLASLPDDSMTQANARINLGIE